MNKLRFMMESLNQSDSARAGHLDAECSDSAWDFTKLTQGTIAGYYSMYSVEDKYWRDPFPGTLADAPGSNFCLLFSDNLGGNLTHY